MEMPPADRHRARAEVLLAQGRPQDALAELDAALGFAPGAAPLHVDRANCLVELDDLDEAEAAIRRALALDPTDAFAHCVLHSVLDDRGDAAGAEAAIRQAITLDPTSAQYHSALSWLLLQQEAWEPALAAAGAALALDPDDRDALITQVFARVQLGRLDEAVAAARRQLAADPTDAASHAMLAVTAMAAGDHESAARSLQEAQRLDPTREWVREFGLVGLGLSGRPLTSALIAWLLTQPRRDPVWVPSLGTALAGPFGLLRTFARLARRPLTTLVLRRTRYGRLTVTPEDAAAARDFAWGLVVTAFVTVAGIVSGGVLLGATILTIFVFAMTLGFVAKAADPWERRTLVLRAGATHAAFLVLWIAGIRGLIVWAWV
jgi:tetratricopeptide (TPR) repeat protein